MAKLKTFCINYDGTLEVIVAATSWKKAAEAIDMSLSQARNYGCETGNHRHIEVATAEPEQPFFTWMQHRPDAVFYKTAKEAREEHAIERAIREEKYRASLRS